MSSLFKNAPGRNFKDYVSEYRYQTACMLLMSNPSMRIKDVAERVGCNAGSLSRLFERYAGMTPGAYQGQLGGGSRGKRERARLWAGFVELS